MKCCICNKPILLKHSHNAEPVKPGRCCTKCNIEKVIPARINQIRR